MKKSTEYCKKCGRKLEFFQPTQISGLIPKTCVCYYEQKEKELIIGIDRARNHMRELSGLSKGYRNKTFENYIPRNENEVLCKKLSMEFADKDYEDTGLWFVMAGNVGVGKTHLSAAIINRIINNCPIDERTARKYVPLGGFDNITPPCKYIRCTDLIAGAKERMDDNTATDFEALCKNTVVLILDDFGVTKATEWNQDLFYRILDHRYINQKPTVISTNLSVEELKAAFGERTYDRIKDMCKMPVIISGESYRGKKELKTGTAD